MVSLSVLGVCDLLGAVLHYIMYGLYTHMSMKKAGKEKEGGCWEGKSRCSGAAGF